MGQARTPCPPPALCPPCRPRHIMTPTPLSGAPASVSSTRPHRLQCHGGASAARLSSSLWALEKRVVGARPTAARNGTSPWGAWAPPEQSSQTPAWPEQSHRTPRRPSLPHGLAAPHGPHSTPAGPHCPPLSPTALPRPASQARPPCGRELCRPAPASARGCLRPVDLWVPAGEAGSVRLPGEGMGLASSPGHLPPATEPVPTDQGVRRSPAEHTSSLPPPNWASLGLTHRTCPSVHRKAAQTRVGFERACIGSADQSDQGQPRRTERASGFHTSSSRGPTGVPAQRQSPEGREL